MCPPGLGFASVSERALEYAAGKPGGRYYFDWGKSAKAQAKGNSAFTPAVPLFLGLDIALDMIREEGLEDVLARHALLARATRAGAAAIGLELYGDADERSTVVTAVELPDSIDGAKVPGALRKLGITANGGQDQLKGRILRIAHCGYFGAFDILTSLSGLEMALSQLGYEVEHGAGVGAAQRVFVEAGVAAAPSDRLVLEQQYKVLVKEKIADSGVNMLRERFAVDVGVDWTDEELAERIGDYHGILIRSATQLTADLIGRADNLRVIGRAGIGVDNVDVEAATKRGIIVANAPQSNIVAAAEHTVALMLSLARNIPQAHASLTAGKWERSKFGGVEVYEKTLGVLGFGRIGQLVAARAQGFGMRVLAFDPFVSAERFRELGVEKAETSADVYREADFITIHLPKTPETRGWLDAEAFAQMKDGVRIINCARGELLVDEALKDALDSGKVAGAALDVFPAEPITDYPLFDGYDNVVVTPHLGASTTEAQDRAGRPDRRAGRRRAHRRRRLDRRQHPRGLGRGHGGARALPAARAAPRPPRHRARRRRHRPRRVRVPRPPRRARHAPAHARDAQRRARGPHRGGGQPRQRALAGRGARDRGRRDEGARGARLHRPRPHHGRRLPRGRHDARPAPPPAPARGLGPALQPPARRRRTSRSSATPTCPAWSAASAPPSASTASTSPRPRSGARRPVRTATATTSP